MITRPLRFAGNSLLLNFATGAAGSIYVGITGADGEPVAGYSTEDCRPLVGDAIEKVVSWRDGKDLSALKGKPIRLRK